MGRWARVLSLRFIASLAFDSQERSRIASLNLLTSLTANRHTSERPALIMCRQRGIENSRHSPRHYDCGEADRRAYDSELVPNPATATESAISIVRCATSFRCDFGQAGTTTTVAMKYRT